MPETAEALEIEGDIILEAKNIESAYSLVPVLRDVSLFVRRGEIVAVIGANGAGKSTTLMCFSRIQPLVSGQIIFEGADISCLPPHTVVGRGLAQVPEGRKIFSRLSVKENLELGAWRRQDRSAIRQDMEEVYSLFPVLRDRAKQMAGTLSGGEQQMLAISRALMSRPKVLMMDEPSMGVAPLLVNRIFEAIQVLNRQGLTILLVEQNARVALNIASRGYVFETGRVILHDDAKALLGNRKVRAAYLGEL